MYIFLIKKKAWKLHDSKLYASVPGWGDNMNVSQRKNFFQKKKTWKGEKEPKSTEFPGKKTNGSVGMHGILGTLNEQLVYQTMNTAPQMNIGDAKSVSRSHMSQKSGEGMARITGMGGVPANNGALIM